MRVFIQIDSTTDDKLDHIDPRNFLSERVHKVQVTLTNHVHHQMACRIAVRHTYPDMCTIYADENAIFSEVRSQLHTINSGETGLQIHSNIATSLRRVHSSHCHLVDDIQIRVQPDIAGIDRDAIVADEIEILVFLAVDLEAERWRSSAENQIEVESWHGADTEGDG